MKLYRRLFFPLFTIGLLGATLSACLTTHTGDGGAAGRASMKSQDEQIAAFTDANLDRLKVDMARGQGEHLHMLAVLLGIPSEQQAEFCNFTKESFPVLFPSDHVAASEMIAILTRELDQHLQIHRTIVMR